MINGLIVVPTHWVKTLASFDTNNTHSNSLDPGSHDREPPPMLDYWLSRFKDLAAVMASMLVIASSIWWIMTFVTGGLKSQDQFAIQDLNAKMVSVQVTLSALSAQISQQPRPDDYRSLLDRLSQYDAKINSLNDKLSETRIDIARMDSRLDTNHAPARNR